MNVVTESLEETYALAEKFIHQLTSSAPERVGACVVLLTGDLGSGKTSFVQGVARALGVMEHVTSPTFVLLKNYQIPSTKLQTNHKFQFKNLIHIDAYRLSAGESAAPLELEEIFANKENIVLIEWPEHVQIKYPKESIELQFRFISENKREITTS